MSAASAAAMAAGSDAYRRFRRQTLSRVRIAYG
jgi:hypothetical protein